MKKNQGIKESQQITSLLYSITEMLEKTHLIEKTPENTFRLD